MMDLGREQYLPIFGSEVSSFFGIFCAFHVQYPDYILVLQKKRSCTIQTSVQHKKQVARDHHRRTIFTTQYRENPKPISVAAIPPKQVSTQAPLRSPPTQSPPPRVSKTMPKSHPDHAKHGRYEIATIRSACTHGAHAEAAEPLRKPIAKKTNCRNDSSTLPHFVCHIVVVVVG